MKEIDNLFFELIRVAIGTQKSLSRVPKANEWGELYEMAKKQSLIGVCFAGLRRLGADADEGFTRIGMSEMQYLTWMGMAAKIQMKNETVDEQCIALQKRLAADGFRSCILKGQGVGQFYAEHLLGLRQSGDIDIWIKGGVEAVVKLADSLGQEADVTEQHVHLDLFEDTEVEAHFTPAVLKSPLAHRRLQKWFEEQAATQFKHRNEAGLCVPNDEFNLVFLLIHVYRHLFGEGVGMRQVMDYYFALLHSGAEDKHKGMLMIEHIGLGKFAAGMMWMLKRVFGLQRADMLCEPDGRHGSFLLNEVLLSGNMGHYDERIKNADRSSRWKRFWLMNRHNFRLVSYYPAETLWAPWSRIRYWVWRKWNGWI